MKNKSIFAMKMNNKWQKFIHSDVRQSVTKKILATIFAILIAFFLALIIACTVCKSWGNFGKVMSTIFTSGFQNGSTVNTLISNMCILIVGGMAFIFAYKAGLFNIGISGQMVAGATVATIVSHLCGLGHGANQVVILILSMIFGALFAGIVGSLKAFLKVNEVVTSIMFNWIIYFMSILLLGSLPIARDASNLNTLAPNDDILFRINGMSWGPLVILAAIVIVFVAIVLNYTVFGRKQRVTGLSNTGALAAGYNVKANMIASMAISGAIAGILGVMVYCGFSPNMPVTAAAKAIPQEGFNGISVGLISMCNPVATVPVSLFFSMVKTSVSDLQIIGIDNHIADVVFGIVVYGAAAITLFLNLKPYWWTLDIFKGKNYSKIKHERNMSNIELLSISSDQCEILRKYFVYYQKQLSAPSTMKLSPIVKSKMRFADMRYWFVSKTVKYRVWRNKETDLLTGNQYYKGEMIHLITKKGQIIVDAKHEKHLGKYLYVTEKVLANRSLLNEIAKAFNNKKRPSANLLVEIRKGYEELVEHPFNDNVIRRVGKLAYLQNLRCGLSYRNTISKQNKLTYFTLQQIKAHAESIGLAEIRSKEQFEFAHSAYLKAYYKTYEIVKAHYDTMVKTFTRDKQLNIMGIRFNPTTLEMLYMRTLRQEIGALSHLINCPLSKSQLLEVGSLVSKTQYLQDRIDTSSAQATSYRKAAQPYFDKSRKSTERARRYHVQLKANAKLLAKLSEAQLSDLEIDEINKIMTNSEELSIEITRAKEEAAVAKQTAENYIIRSKDLTESVAVDTAAKEQANRKLAAIVENARANEKVAQNDKWALQKQANDEAEKELRRIELKKTRKLAKKGVK